MTTKTAAQLKRFTVAAGALDWDVELDALEMTAFELKGRSGFVTGMVVQDSALFGEGDDVNEDAILRAVARQLGTPRAWWVEGSWNRGGAVTTRAIATSRKIVNRG